MLKLIPLEPFSDKKKNGQQNKKSVNITKLQLRDNRELDTDSRFIRHVCVDFIHYIEKGAAYDVFKIGKLIHNLRLSVLGLERKRFKLLRKKKKNRIK